MYRKIDDRLFIEPDGFGDYMPEVVEFLLGNIAVDMQSLIDTPAKRKSVYIQYAWNFEYPQCNDAWPHRIIFLHTRGNYWCQWVYQFAHEYLHHMISGTMTGVISGVMWFEETLCEVSSLYHLYHMAHAFSYHRFPILQAYAPAVRDYLNDLTESNRGLKQELLSNGGIRQWLPLLFEPTHH